MRPDGAHRAADHVTIDVLRGLAEGLSDREIAHRVHISTRTVQRLLDNFREATGAPTRFAAGRHRLPPRTAGLIG